MPNIEFMTMDGRKYGGQIKGERAFNLTRSVGIGCSNNPADVKLIQCIFTTLAIYSGETHVTLGTPNEDIPAPNGRYTTATGQVILNYQTWNSYILLGVDGRIHPASFSGRVLRSGGVKRMTIQRLNEDLAWTSARLGGSWNGGVDLVLMIFPELRAILVDKTQGLRSASTVS